MIDPVAPAQLAQGLIGHIDQSGIQSGRILQPARGPLYHAGDDMGDLVDIDHHPRHVAGAEKLPGRILIYDAVVLHQIVSRKIGAVEQLHRMKQEIVAADADGIRRKGGLVAGDGHCAVRAVSVCPQSGAGILRILNHRRIGQRLIDAVPELNETILSDPRIHGEKTADLRCVPLAAPPIGRCLVRLAASQTMGRHKQDQEHYKGNSSAYSQYYFFHQPTSFPSGQRQLLASLTSFPASTGLVDVVITNS